MVGGSPRMVNASVIFAKCPKGTFSAEGLNQMIERVNNTVRDREKTFRGTDTDKSAQVMADGIRINYNFIRPHMGLDGRTLAQAAELDLGLDGIKWKALIKKAISRPAPLSAQGGESP